MERAKSGNRLPPSLPAEPSAHLSGLLLGSDVEDNGVPFSPPHSHLPSPGGLDVEMLPVEVGSLWCPKGSVPGDPEGGGGLVKRFICGMGCHSKESPVPSVPSPPPHHEKAQSCLQPIHRASVQICCAVGSVHVPAPPGWLSPLRASECCAQVCSLPGPQGLLGPPAAVERMHTPRSRESS